VVSYEAGDQNLTRYLELGHLTTAEKTAPFAQFLSISHGIKFETIVKDELLTIYSLRMHIGPLNKIISTDLSLVSEF
jgi:hypothetical protein